MAVSLSIVRNRQQDLVLSWNFNPRYDGHRQTAFQIRRQSADGSAVRYRSADNRWMSTPQTIVSSNTNFTITPTWQGADDSRFFFVRVRDEGNRWSTWAAPLEVDTRLIPPASLLNITSPSVNQQVGQLPVMTWEASEQVSYELRVTELPYINETDILWSQEEQLGDTNRATLYVPNTHTTTVSLEVRVRDAKNRLTPWIMRTVTPIFTPRAVPPVRVLPTTAAGILVGLENASDAVGVTKCIISRRINPSSSNVTKARNSGASEKEIDEEVRVFELDHAPVSTQTSAVEDHTVRFDIDYQYKFLLEWDSDETRVETDWEG